MGVTLRTATTADELDEVFRLRHRVMVDEQRYFSPTPDGRLLDRFDAYPGTINIIARLDDATVGTTRITPHTALGTPTDELFNFTPYLPVPSAMCCHGSQFLVLPTARTHPRLVAGLLGMTFVWGRRAGFTHMTAVGAPASERVLLNAGFRRLAAPYLDPHSGLTLIPMVLAFDAVTPAYRRLLDLHLASHLFDLPERRLYPVGECIIRESESGHEAFLVIAGRVEVRREPGVRVARLGPGAVFGEQALFADLPRTASVFAATECDLMVVPRTDLRERLTARPELALAMLGELSRRLAATTRGAGV